MKTPVERVTFNDRMAADYLGVSRTSLWKLLKEGRFPCVRVGGRTLFRRADLDEFLDSCVVRAA